jgi:hypothetical protein
MIEPVGAFVASRKIDPLRGTDDGYRHAVARGAANARAWIDIIVYRRPALP